MLHRLVLCSMQRLQRICGIHMFSLTWNFLFCTNKFPELSRPSIHVQTVWIIMPKSEHLFCSPIKSWTTLHQKDILKHLLMIHCWQLLLPTSVVWSKTGNTCVLFLWILTWQFLCQVRKTSYFQQVKRVCQMQYWKMLFFEVQHLSTYCNLITFIEANSLYLSMLPIE